MSTVSTYYQRNWSELPSPLEYGFKKTDLHHLRNTVALALRYLGLLYKPAGRMISYSYAGVNLAHHSYQMFSTKRYSFHGWKALKAGIELAGTYKSLREGLIAHTAMSLLEDCRDLWNKKDKSLKDAIPFISWGLYLSTLLELPPEKSSNLIKISLLYQVAITLYYSYQNIQHVDPNDFRPIEIFNIVSSLGLPYVYSCLEQKV